ncbi:MAG: GPI anchored serine-threonine rich family protein, partial [Promethearchaeota archaeon]
APLGNDWWVILYDNADAATYDFSDDFQIVDTAPPDSITVTGPTGGSAWVRGYNLGITWTTTGSISFIDIDIMKDVTLMDQVIGTVNDGSYNWSIPIDAPLGNDWWVILYDNADAATYDFSDDFEIVEMTSISLTSPTGGETWDAGTTHEITWTWTGSFSNVDIFLYSGATLVDTIASNDPNDGSHSWNIPSNTPAGKMYWIAVVQVGGIEAADWSTFFNITSSIVRSITITRPTESSSWNVGDTEIIRWTSTGSIPSVDIILAKGEGDSATIEYEFYGITNTGQYSWSIPSNAKTGDDWNLVIYDHADVLIYDSVIGFEISSGDGDGDGKKPAVPGYNLIFLVISLFGMSIILLRKRLRKYVKI